MSTSEHMHGHTTVTVDDRSTLPRATQFFKDHSTLIGVALLGAGFLLANRVMLRKELTKLNFSAEFWPDDFIDPEFLE